MNIIKTINKIFPWQWKYYTGWLDWSFMIFTWGAVFSGLFGLFVDQKAFVICFGFWLAMLTNYVFMPASLPTKRPPIVPPVWASRNAREKEHHG
jgi:uncharacterized membrane protein YoaK (UPF0700 family)